MQMRLAFDRRESVELLGASDGSVKLTTQMSQWSSGALRSPCCLISTCRGTQDEMVRP